MHQNDLRRAADNARLAARVPEHESIASRLRASIASMRSTRRLAPAPQPTTAAMTDA